MEKTPMLRILQILVIAVTTLLLGVTGVLLILESGWATPPAKTKEEAFLHGSIGVEIMPLAAFQVLPDMFPDRFQPDSRMSSTPVTPRRRVVTAMTRI
jgi:hypothetical protein